jgi:hypothetical protein
MFVTPPEVLPLASSLLSIEFSVIPVLFRQVNAVSTIFLAVPRMVVVAIPIVVPSLAVIVGPHRHWRHQGGGGKKRRQNYKSTHDINLLSNEGSSVALPFSLGANRV